MAPVLQAGVASRAAKGWILHKFQGCQFNEDEFKQRSEILDTIQFPVGILKAVEAKKCLIVFFISDDRRTET